MNAQVDDSSHGHSHSGGGHGHSHEHGNPFELSGKEMLAGGIAGITEHSFMFPFDTVKTKMQASGSQFTSTTACLRHIVKNESWTNLYRGCVPIVLSAFPAHGAYFAIYEASKRVLSANSSSGYAASAVCATMAHDLISVPFDVVKQRMQVDTRHKTSFSCLRHIVRSEGTKRLFVSYPTTVAMNVPHIATQWVVYEAAKARLTERGLMEDEWSPYYLLAGFTAGATAAVVSTPFDVIKTRMQLSESSKSASTVVREVIRENGVRGFFKGAFPRTMYIAPSAAVVLSTYEACKLILHID